MCLSFLSLSAKHFCKEGVNKGTQIRWSVPFFGPIRRNQNRIVWKLSVVKFRFNRLWIFVFAPTPNPGMGFGVLPDISYIGMGGMCDFKTGRSIESWRKFTADPRSSVFSKSAKPLNLSQKSAICTLFKVKPVDPQIYSPPLLLLLSWAKRTWNLFPFGTRVLFHPPRACHTLVCLTTTNSSRAVCKFRT